MGDAPPAMLSIAGTPAANSLGQWSWAGFQWARDFGGSAIIVFIFAPYFTSYVVGDPVYGQALWGHLNALAGLSSGLCAPVLGAIADARGRRKPWLALFVMLMVVTSTLLWWSKPGGQGLGVAASSAVLILYTVAYNLSDVFQSSMLPTISEPTRIGFLSGLGVALAQASTLVGLLVVLWAFMLPGQVAWSLVPAHPLFGIDPASHENSRVIGPFSAAWLLLFSLPLFIFTPETDRGDIGRMVSAVRVGIHMLWMTTRKVGSYRNVAKFLIARICFNDGQVAIMIFSAIYAAGEFSWKASTLTCYALILSFVSFGGALVGGWLCDRLGAKPAIIIGIAASAIGLVLGLSITPHSLFYFIVFPQAPLTGLPFFTTLPDLVYMITAVLTCTCVIAVFGASRTMMARIAPLDKLSQFFGLYALSGSITAFIGPELVALTTSAFHSQRAGMASLLALLSIGAIVMIFVKEERASSVDV